MTQSQVDDISRFYDLIKSDSGVIECFFIISEDKKAIRFYNDKEKFIKDVTSYNSRGYTCYAGIQPRKRELLNNPRPSTKDDIVALRFLYIDIDPRIPDDEKINATDEEKKRCLETATHIQGILTDVMEYQEPILTNSGNGNWLLMPIPEITINDENRSGIDSKLKSWGKQIKNKFENENIKIDSSVFELRRITKIPGTKIFNKPDEPDRPQRISGIISEEFPQEPDQLLRDDFLAISIEKKNPQINQINNFDPQKPHNHDRIFENCYLIRFLKEKGDEGVNFPHPVRLALSSLSLAMGDLDNNLAFIEQIIGGNPDYSADKTRYFLQQNQNKCSPYGCKALRDLVSEHFNDFDLDQCKCNLTPSIDPSTGNMRVPSPIRFAYLMESDLEKPFSSLEFKKDDSFYNIMVLRSFAQQYLTSFDVATARSFLKSKREKCHITNEDIKDLLIFRKTAIALSEKEEKITILSEEQKQHAIEILKRPSLLYDYGKFVQKSGIVGEDRNIRIVLLSLTSRLLDNLISLIIKAESSSGKSFLLKQCLAAFPREYYFEFTTMSNKAIFYTEKDFKHKFIIFYEYNGQNDEINYLIRTLQSEGRLRYETTEKIDGQYVTRCIEKDGPTGFFTTTTRPQLFDENETRNFSLFVNDSEEQTKKILMKLGDQFTYNGNEISQEEIKSWKNIQRVLEPLKVIIPYAPELAKNVPSNRLRIRRDFERILQLIAICALLHQYQRKIIERTGQKYVIASIVDYLMVRELLEGENSDTISKTVQGTSPQTDKIVVAVWDIYQLKQDELKEIIEHDVNSGVDKHNDTLVSIPELIAKIGMGESTVRKWIKPALENGYIESMKSGKYVYYKPVKKIEEKKPFLPEPEMIITKASESEKDVQFVHPLTGEFMNVAMDKMNQDNGF